MWVLSNKFNYGVVLYNFDGTTVPSGLTLDIGETVQVIEECEGWLRGFSLRQNNVVGIFPMSYVCSKECIVDSSRPWEIVTPVEDSTVKEVAFVLKELSVIWKRLYVDRKMDIFKTVRPVMLKLISWRRMILSKTFSQEDARDVKLNIVKKIDWLNAKLGLDLVPRIDAEQVDPVKISMVELYNIHKESAEHSSSARVLRYAGKQKESHLHHLFISLQGFRCTVSDEMEIIFQLYDAKQSKYISERFITRIGRNDNFHKVVHSSALFTDLDLDPGNLDPIKDIYLVGHVYRKGRMKQREESSKKKATYTYRRAYGCAVISFHEILANDLGVEENKEFHLKVFSCSAESDFPQLHENIIRKQNTRISLVSGQQANCGIVITQKLLKGDIEVVKRENLFILKKLTIVKRLGFCNVILPGDVRNDVYINLERGEFDKAGKSVGKNIEVKVLLLDGNNKVIEDSMFLGSGEGPQKEINSVVFYHNNLPKWNEMIKLSIPIEKFHLCHVRFEFRHASLNTDKKLFAFGYIKMTKNGATLTDGSHELFLYKCEDISRLQIEYYYSLPCTSADVSPTKEATRDNSFFQRSAKETAFITTQLCSTKFTQNSDLQSFLQWRSEPDKIELNIKKLMNVDGDEIVKFMNDIFDALFVILSTKNPPSTLVFQALVYMCRHLYNPKYKHFKSVMDNYIKEAFSAAMVYNDLMKSLISQIDLSPGFRDQTLLTYTFEVLEDIFHFIVQSRTLSCLCDNQFVKSLESFFNCCTQFMQNQMDSLTNSQVLLLENLHKIYNRLLEQVSEQELSNLICDFLNNIPRDHKPIIIRAQIQALQDCVKSKMFLHKGSRDVVMAVCMGHLKRYLICNNELSSCANLLGDILVFIHAHKEHEDMNSDINGLVKSILDVVSQCVMSINRSSLSAGPLVSCLMGMLQLMNEDHYICVLESYKAKPPLKEFLQRLLSVFTDLIRTDIFPSDWMVMRMEFNSAIAAASQYLDQALKDKFKVGPDLDVELWTSYFHLAVAFITQDSLQMERFSAAKQDKIREKYLDMRIIMAIQIVTMWNSLGSSKINFVPAMVGPFLEVTLVPVADVRKATLPILFDMMQVEQEAKRDMAISRGLSVEYELIEKLDILIGQNKGDVEYRQLFEEMMLQEFKASDQEWKESGTAFVKSVNKLLELLLDYRRCCNGTSFLLKMLCTVNLLNFYKNEIAREEMYIRYIYKLCELHLNNSNFVEAAFTLSLHAGLLDWSDIFMKEEFGYPAQCQFKRKEHIYRKIIDYYDKGKSWEYSFKLCEELADLYKRLYDYHKLSEILRMQAQFYENILSENLRFVPTFFRVGFYGLSLPGFIRNKTFVYRGREMEQLEGCRNQLCADFPNAVIMTVNTPPDDEVLNANGVYIQMCTVSCSPSERLSYKGAALPSSINKFYEYNEVCAFKYDRPFHNAPQDENNQFKTLCYDRTKLKLVDKLPGILRYGEVNSIETVFLPPIETAIVTVQNMNRELRKISDLYKFFPDNQSSLSPLTMRLNGVIFPAVNGGLQKYQEAFFIPEFAENNPGCSQNINRLKKLLLEELQILEAGLKIHGTLASPEVQPLHDVLVVKFDEMKKSIRESGSPDVSRALLRTNLENDGRPESSDSSRSFYVERESNIYGEISDLNVERRTISSDLYGDRVSNIYGEIGDFDEDGNVQNSMTMADTSSTLIMEKSSDPNLYRMSKDSGIGALTHFNSANLEGSTRGSDLESLDSGSYPPSSSESTDVACAVADIPQLPPRKYSVSESEVTERMNKYTDQDSHQPQAVSEPETISVANRDSDTIDELPENIAAPPLPKKYGSVYGYPVPGKRQSIATPISRHTSVVYDGRNGPRVPPPVPPKSRKYSTP